MRSIFRSRKLGLLSLIMGGALASTALALINISFTPVELIKAADSIVLLEGTPAADGKQATFKVVKVLKGKDPGITTIDVGDLANDEGLTEYMKQPKVPALLFIGNFQKARAGAEVNAIGAIHIGTDWYGVRPVKDGLHELVADSLDLKAVWEGGNGTLLQAVQYVLTARDPVIRASAGVSWADIRAIGKLPGVASEPACRIKDGRPELLFASKDGDAIITTGADGALTITRAASKSLAATYSDLDQDGVANRVGYDGKQLYFIDAPDKPAPICDLAGAIELLPVTIAGKPALLATLPAGAAIIKKGANGYETANALAAPLSGVLRARVFDANGDGVPDLLFVTAKQLLLAKGKAGGGYDAPQPVADARDVSLHDVKVADFDSDGNLDVLLIGADEHGLQLFAGDGKGGFADVTDETGELSIHGTGPMVSGVVADFNNDGLLDVILVPAQGPPRAMFNRGYRTFGFSRNLDFGTSQMPNNELLIGKDTPSQVTAAAIADFRGNGINDLLCVSDGQLVLVTRAVDKANLGVRITAAPGAAVPISVTARTSERILGGAVLDTARPVFFGTPVKGPVDIEWVCADGSKGSKRVIVLKPTDIELGGSDKPSPGAATKP